MEDQPYIVAHYGQMLSDSVRMKAYSTALRQAVTTETVLVDIGSGTGIFALIACSLGAKRVYAIEPEDVIGIARELVEANGFSNRVVFIQSRSADAKLPERADVIVSDLRGVLPLHGDHLPSIIDARERFLSPDGQLIPRRDTLWVAACEAPSMYDHLTGPWERNEFGLDLSPARRFTTSTWGHEGAPTRPLSSSACWSTIDYSSMTDSNVQGCVSLTVKEKGNGHGLRVWFDAELADGCSFSNSPGSEPTVYGSAFFPWSSSVPMAPGDKVDVSLWANRVGGEYVWRWRCRVSDPGGTKAEFHQSSFDSLPLSSEGLRKTSASFVATLDESGQIDSRILSLMDGERTLEQIARQITKEYSHCFVSWKKALDRVAELSERYSR